MTTTLTAIARMLLRRSAALAEQYGHPEHADKCRAALRGEAPAPCQVLAWTTIDADHTCRSVVHCGVILTQPGGNVYHAVTWFRLAALEEAEQD